MSSRPRPYFPMYVAEWLGSSLRAGLTLAEQGAFMALLCRQWDDPTCSLPDDDEILAGLSELEEAWHRGPGQRIRAGFPRHPSLVYRVANPFLLELREQQERWLKKCSQGGKKAAAKAAAKRAAEKGKKKRTPKTKAPQPRQFPTSFDR